MGIRKKKTLVEQAVDYVEQTVEQVRPHVEQAVDTARDRAVPLLAGRSRQGRTGDRGRP